MCALDVVVHLWQQQRPSGARRPVAEHLGSSGWDGPVAALHATSFAQGHAGGTAVGPHRSLHSPLRHQFDQQSETGHEPAGRVTHEELRAAALRRTRRRLGHDLERHPHSLRGSHGRWMRHRSGRERFHLHLSQLSHLGNFSYRIIHFPPATTGEIKNGFAIVRPPGHHAESQQAMGFCFFNSIAIAAKQLRLKHKLERILIVDWVSLHPAAFSRNHNTSLNGWFLFLGRSPRQWHAANFLRRPARSLHFRPSSRRWSVFPWNWKFYGGRLLFSPPLARLLTQPTNISPTVRNWRRNRLQCQRCLVGRVESAFGRRWIHGGIPHSDYAHCSSKSPSLLTWTVAEGRFIFGWCLPQDFDPEIVLVSAGFDAATGHPSPLGGYQVSAACFGFMTRQLMQLAGGKVIMALEGGYDLPAICDASYECVRALLGDESAPIRPEELRRRPCRNAVETLHKCISIQVGPRHSAVVKHAIQITQRTSS